MAIYILKGTDEAKDKFINDFIIQEKIPPYNVQRYSEALKIADVRTIKKAISITAAGKNRLLIVESEPTIEAQNAMLKILEELSSDTSFIFMEGRELLPTIVSRCFIVNLGIPGEVLKDENEITASDQVIIDKMLVSSNSAQTLLVFDEFFSDDFAFARLIRLTHICLLSAIKDNHFDKSYRLFKFLTMLEKKNSLVSSNNLNARFAVEKIVLEEF